MRDRLLLMALAGDGDPRDVLARLLPDPRAICDSLPNDEHELARQMSQLRVGVSLLDRELRYRMTNGRGIGATQRLVRSEQIVGLSIHDLLPNMPPQWTEACRRCLAGESVTGELEIFRRGDGTLIAVRWALRPHRGSEGQVLGILGVNVPHLFGRTASPGQPGLIADVQSVRSILRSLLRADSRPDGDPPPPSGAGAGR